MPYIIDGHNLIGKLASIDLADPDDEEALMRLLAQYFSKQRKRGVVFFDRGLIGTEKEFNLGRLSVRFSTPPQTADDAIRKYLISIAPEATNYTVVSSDTEVQNAAKRIGAQCQSSETFANLISSFDITEPLSEKPDQPLSQEDKDDLEKMFNLGNSDE